MTASLVELRIACAEVVRCISPEPEREGLRETPDRMSKALHELTSGYDRDPQAILKSFDDGAESYDEMVMQGPIPAYSLCEHHVLPFFGNVYIGYLPNKRIVGLSKLKRLVDVFARRLQVQERLTAQIASTLYTGLECKGAAVVIKARHLCMEMRGVCSPGIVTTTSSLQGVMRETEPRSEFLSFVSGVSDRGGAL